VPAELNGHPDSERKRLPQPQWKHNRHSNKQLDWNGDSQRGCDTQWLALSQHLDREHQQHHCLSQPLRGECGRALPVLSWDGSFSCTGSRNGGGGYGYRQLILSPIPPPSHPNPTPPHPTPTAVMLPRRTHPPQTSSSSSSASRSRTASASPTASVSPSRNPQAFVLTVFELRGVTKPGRSVQHISAALDAQSAAGAVGPALLCDIAKTAGLSVTAVQLTTVQSVDATSGASTTVLVDASAFPNTIGDADCAVLAVGGTITAPTRRLQIADDAAAGTTQPDLTLTTRVSVPTGNSGNGMVSGAAASDKAAVIQTKIEAAMAANSATSAANGALNLGPMARVAAAWLAAQSYNVTLRADGSAVVTDPQGQAVTAAAATALLSSAVHATASIGGSAVLQAQQDAAAAAADAADADTKRTTSIVGGIGGGGVGFVVLIALAAWHFRRRRSQRDAGGIRVVPPTAGAPVSDGALDSGVSAVEGRGIVLDEEVAAPDVPMSPSRNAAYIVSVSERAGAGRRASRVGSVGGRRASATQPAAAAPGAADSTQHSDAASPGDAAAAGGVVSVQVQHDQRAAGQGGAPGQVAGQASLAAPGTPVWLGLPGVAVRVAAPAARFGPTATLAAAPGLEQGSDAHASALESPEAQWQAVNARDDPSDAPARDLAVRTSPASASAASQRTVFNSPGVAGGDSAASTHSATVVTYVPGGVVMDGRTHVSHPSAIVSPPSAALREPAAAAAPDV